MEVNDDGLDTTNRPNNSNHSTTEATPKEINFDGDIKPTVGMEFDTIDKAEEFYKRYAHNVGFSVRSWTTVRDKKSGVITWKYFVCSKQGFNQPPKGPSVPDQQGTDFLCDSALSFSKPEVTKESKTRATKETREGCEAKIKLKRNDHGKYVVRDFVEQHTHGLATPTKRHLLRSARKVNSAHKAIFFSCNKANMGPSQAYHLMKNQANGFQRVGCTQKDLQNYQTRLKVLIHDADAHMFIENFERKKEVDPSFYFAYEVDGEGRLKHVFWTDRIGRTNYALFGDVVSFDSTYGTNKYSMIFTPFTGRNHHRQCVTFAASFLGNEKVESFVWLFQKFLEAMGGLKPKCIITDQDPAMKIAIEKIFDTSSHRYCMWHILRKVPEKIGGVLNSNAEFHKRLQACVWSSDTPEDFEQTWASIIDDYELKNNDWFTSMFEMRPSWIPAYFRDLFLAGLFRTTSISESENSIFGSLTNKWLNLIEFWVRYDSIIERQRNTQNTADHVTFHSHPKLRTQRKIEIHARDLYTHVNFYIFQEEFLSSCIDCGVKETSIEKEGLVYIVQESCHGTYKQRIVTYNTSNDVAQCSCKFFEQDGIPCRHILCIFKGRNIDALPDYIIVPRWIKNASRLPTFDMDHVMTEGLSEKQKAHVEISELWKDFNSCVGAVGFDIDKIHFLRNGLISLKKTLLERNNIPSGNMANDLEAYIGTTLPVQINVHPPKHSSTKGSGKRLKSGKEKAMEQQKKPTRHCKTCGKYGYHDSRNCPTKKNLS